MRSTRQEHVAMTVARNAARLLNRAGPAMPLILAAAIAGFGLVHLTVASHVREAAAPVAHVRSTPYVDMIVPASVESGLAEAVPSSAQPSLPAIPIPRFRFGFLEFEDDFDASTK